MVFTALAMTTSRDRVIRTLNHEPVDRAPRDLWIAPGTESLHGDEAAELSYRYPNDFTRAEFLYPRGHRAKGSPHEPELHTDAWGCTWHEPQRGLAGEVHEAPLADLRRLATYRPPWELLEKSSFSSVDRSCAATSRFVLGWTDVRPLGRLQCLHGTQSTSVDLAAGGMAVRDLLDMLHDFYCRELSSWAATEVDGVVFADDWDFGEGLLLSPEVFRSLFKPLYRQYCEILHAQDKFALFRCGGNVEAVFGDLVEIGVDAIHCPLFLMNVESLASRFRNRITFWGQIVLQRTLASGTIEEVRAAVRRLRAALDFGRGGLIAQCEYGAGIPFQNIIAAFEEWLSPVPMHVRAK
jgi:hypothetical protein